MSENNPSPADEKALAMYYGYVALVKTLHDDGVLNMDHLFQNLAGATTRLSETGESGAASLLGGLAESLTAI